MFLNRSLVHLFSFLSLSFSTFFCENAFSGIISGRVTDESGDPLPYTSVFIKGTATGTSTNTEGYYKLETGNGLIELVYRFIGYKTISHKIEVANTPVLLNVTLEKENYSLKEVVITAGEDPAYAIIRYAVEKRKFYLTQVDAYSCDVYIKGLQRLLKWPKKLLGREINIEQFVDSISGIIYLSESVSKFNFKAPDNIHEEMISSRVSGNSKAFSYNQASDMLFNFYENLMETGISPRGVVSPIAGNALFYYKYRLEGSFEENGTIVHKISVIPKRKNDPVFRGTIFIQDSTWRIHSLDLVLTKDAQLQFVDTLSIKQVFVPVIADNSIWLNASNQFGFHFSAFGFIGNGNYAGVFSNYKMGEEWVEKKFGGEIMKVNDDANKKDSTYWNSIRPVPLTREEQTDYIKKDSLQTIKESKLYLDSIDSKTNKITPGKILLTGYGYRQRYKKQEFNFSPLIQNIQFNTVEGLDFSLAPDYTKIYEKDKKKRIIISPFLKYGVANKTFNATLKAEYNYSRVKFAYITLEGGRNSFQYNDRNPISPIINTSYSLFGEKNYMKLYSKTFGAVGYRAEPVNGISVNLRAEFAERSPMVNHTDYTFKDVESRSYTSNNPLNPADDATAFAKNQSLSGEVQMNFRIRQKYISRPDIKFISGSKFPTVSINFRKGFDALSSDVDYGLLRAGVSDEMKLGLLGSLEYEVVYGNFVQADKIYFLDFRHFNGNQTIFSKFDIRKFNLLDYYSNSTNNEFVEVHTENHFNGFIFNKIPLLRQLKLDEIAGFHFLHVPETENYYEFSFGLSKLNIFRVDFVIGFTESSKTQTGIRIALAGL